MVLTCGHCGDEIPEGDWGAWEAVDDGVTDELVAHKYDPEESIAIAETAFYCDPECFAAAVEDGDLR